MLLVSNGQMLTSKNEMYVKRLWYKFLYADDEYRRSVINSRAEYVSKFRTQRHGHKAKLVSYE